MQNLVSIYVLSIVVGCCFYNFILTYECRDDCCNGRYGPVPDPWNVLNCTKTGPGCPDDGYLLTTTDNKTYCITGKETNKGNHPQTIGAIFPNCSGMNVGKDRLITRYIRNFM
ncbi:CC chemokine family protein [Penguinpox virus]|uniref:CC chemokine family protein n=1 Tax=Penguinpox virus TaxID=648998 RepID=A0A068ELD9_9POXV|nr:CC chemokine family protein [Penguinpox virus]AID46802.1 CC chemokine family protein [Penguinpox virus]